MFALNVNWFKLDIKETSVVVILSNCLRFTLRSASTIWELSSDWFDSRSHQAAPTAYIYQTTLRREHQSAGIWAAYDFQHCPCQHIKKLLERLPQLTRSKRREKNSETTNHQVRHAHFWQNNISYDLHDWKLLHKQEVSLSFQPQLV